MMGLVRTHQFDLSTAWCLSVYCRGVFWDKKTSRWRCQLGYQSKKIFLGYFDDASEAARAYDQKLVELRGAGGRPATFLSNVSNARV